MTFALTVLLAACGDDATTVPDAGARDASVEVDGRVPPLPDAGAQMDAGVTAVDAGVGLICGGSACDLRDAESCGEGASCRVVADGAECVALGDAGLGVARGEACTALGDCAPGLVCFERRAGGGICGAPCCPGDGTGCGGEALICEGGGLVDGTVSTWGECRMPRSCTLFAEGCELGETCTIVEGRMTECRRAGEVLEGYACSSQARCAPGLFCAGLFESTCVRICAIGDNSPCAEDESCQSYASSPEGYGLCTPMSSE